jgi:long-chain fatty acid transport protein
MMQICKPLLAFALGVGAVMPVAVFATNGYFGIGYGMVSRGMGGATAALPQDSLIAAINPAGMAVIGSRFDLGMDMFKPPRRVSANGESGFGTANNKSTDNFFPIPAFGVNFQKTDRLSLGISVVGNGANTHYKQNFFDITGLAAGQTYGDLGVQLVQMQILPTAAYKITNTQSIGASLVIGVQNFWARGLGNFNQPQFLFSADPDKLTDKGNDWGQGAGLRVGWLGKFFDDRLSFGAAYGSKVYMSKLSLYKGLFANGGEFDIPANWVVGLAVKATPRLTFAYDYQKIYYSDVPAIGNRHATTSLFNEPCTQPVSSPSNPVTCANAGNTPNSVDQALGGSNSWGFGWKDQIAHKFGVQYEAWPGALTLRAGFNYGKSPIPDDQLLFSMLAPAVTQNHVTMGGTMLIDKDLEVSLSYVRAFKNSQSCVAPTCKTMLTQTDGQYVAVELQYQALGFAFALRF